MLDTNEPRTEVPRSVRLAGTLLMVSGVTHLAQLLVYDDARTLAGVSSFGVAYLILGALIRQNRRGALWVGATLPVLGGAAGTYRFLVVQPNPFSVWHVAIDFVVVPVCCYWLLRNRSAALGVALLVCLVSSGARAGDDPARADEIHRLEAGEVLISTRQVPGRSVPFMKAIGLVRAPPEKVWSVVQDCSNYKNTMPRVVDSAELVRAGDTVRCRVLLDMPFPFSDLVAETEALHTIEPGGRYKRSWSHRAGDFLENTGSWTLEPHEGGKATIVTYEVLSEPNVPLPQSILKAAQETTLPDVFVRLRQRLE